MAQLVSENVGNVYDLGSSPRSTLFPYYFAIHVHMQFQKWSAPYIFLNQASTCPASTITRLRIEEHSGSQSTPLHVNKKVHKARNWIGLKILGLNLLFGDYHPPWFTILYIFLIFYFQLLFYFLYCFELINYFHKI